MVKEEPLNFEDRKNVMDKYRDAIGKDLKTKVIYCLNSTPIHVAL